MKRNANLLYHPIRIQATLELPFLYTVGRNRQATIWVQLWWT